MCHIYKMCMNQTHLFFSCIMKILSTSLLATDKGYMAAESCSLQSFLDGFCFPFCQVLNRAIHRRETLASVSSHSPSAVQNQHAEPFSCCCNMQRKATECETYPISSYISEHRPGLHFNSYSMRLCFNSDPLLMYQIYLKKLPSC